MREISTAIDIKASPDQVWAVLADFPGYASWNPFIREGSGEAVPGARLRLRMFPSGGRPMTFTPTVLTAEPGRTLSWLGRLVLPGLFDGTHTFVLTETPEGTRLVQGESFKGLLVPLLGGLIERTRNDFASMNEALRKRLES